MNDDELAKDRQAAFTTLNVLEVLIHVENLHEELELLTHERIRRVDVLKMIKGKTLERLR